MMQTAAFSIAWRLALCVAIAWAVWRIGGLVPMVAVAPLFGVALAKPLLDLASDLRHQARARALKPVQGRHFAFRGTPIDVLEDADHRRWVRAADVRAIVGATASNGALALSYPSGWREFGRPATPYFSDDALLAHLAKERSPEALRFRHWVERDIAFPAQRMRERLGIRLPAPDAVER
jgi:hypothetical protein